MATDLPLLALMMLTQLIVRQRRATGELRLRQYHGEVCTMQRWIGDEEGAGPRLCEQHQHLSAVICKVRCLSDGLIRRERISGKVQMSAGCRSLIQEDKRAKSHFAN